VQDKNARIRFLELARQKKSVSEDPFDPFQANLTIGNQDWSSPFQLSSETSVISTADVGYINLLGGLEAGHTAEAVRHVTIWVGIYRRSPNHRGDLSLPQHRIGSTRKCR
jgi:hypothetical protein